MKKVLKSLLILIILCNVRCNSAQDCPEGINLLPMYGQVEKCPEQKKSDEEFIFETDKQFKNRKLASEYFVNKGWDYFYQNDLDTAMKRFNQAWLLDNSNPNVFWGFGNILGKKKEFENSITYLEKSINLNPNNAKVYYCLSISYGQLYLKDKNIKYKNLTIENLKKSIEIEPKNGMFYGQLASFYACLSEKDSLRKYIKITDEIDPNFINPEVRKFALKK